MPLGERFKLPRNTWFTAEPLLNVNVSEIMLTGLESGALVCIAPPLNTNVAFPKAKAFETSRVLFVFTNTIELAERSLRFCNCKAAVFPLT